MKTLVLGSKGQLGHALDDTAPDGAEFVGLDLPELDISNAQDLLDICREIKPAVIINNHLSNFFMPSVPLCAYRQSYTCRLESACIRVLFPGDKVEVSDPVFHFIALKEYLNVEHQHKTST